MTDSADRGQFIKLYVRLVIGAGPLLLLALFAAVQLKWLPGWVALLLGLSIPGVLYPMARLLFWAMDRTAVGLTNMVYAGGGHPLPPAHSGIESLEARGFYVEAAAGWRQHLLAFPTDNLARFKLAALCRHHLDRDDEAEGVLLEVRRSAPSDPEERQVSNLLIDLFHATGQKDREIVELARFADRWKGKRAGEDAARKLRELKQGSDE